MIILGIDPGRARTGVAVCDPREIMASPVTVIHERSREALCEEIASVAAERMAELIVVGLPKNMDGTEGPAAAASRELGAMLEQRCGLPVELWDERGTTITAQNLLNESDTRGSRRKAVIDSVAAVIILEEYLAKRKNDKP